MPAVGLEDLDGRAVPAVPERVIEVQVVLALCPVRVQNSGSS